MHGTYLIYLLIFFIGPTVALWLLFGRRLWHYRTVFVVMIAVGWIGGSLWDALAISSNIWVWPVECCIVRKIGVLPVEEFLFMTVTPIYVATVTILVRDAVIQKHHAKRRVKA